MNKLVKNVRIVSKIFYFFMKKLKEKIIFVVRIVLIVGKIIKVRVGGSIDVWIGKEKRSMMELLFLLVFDEKLVENVGF